MNYRSGRCAVLVDDDALVLLALAATFEDWGYDVLTAESADQAVERLEASGRTPDIVVVDYRLRDSHVGTDASCASGNRSAPRFPESS